MNRTAALLDFVRAPHRLPDRVRADTLRLLADTLAVGAAGATAPGGAAAAVAARQWGNASQWGGTSRLLGEEARLPAAGAAFVNGFRIHCLEWDAVHEPAVVHALSTVTAALGAAIDRMGGADPEAALTALAVGVDVACGLGLAADTPLAFFRPATAGLLGAAMAVARIEALEPLADVLGLAYSFCAGTMQAHVEGSIALPLQIANAARAAITAVDLVRAGFTAPHDVLEGPFGYFHLFDHGDLRRYTDHLGAVWRISEISTKPFPSGRASHAALAALAAFQGRDVQRIEAFVPPLIARLVARPMRADMTPAYARLCLPFLSVLMLEDGRIDPRRFTTATFADPSVAERAARLTITIDDNPDLNALSPQRLVVDGEEIDIPHSLGSPEAPQSARQATAKLDLARELAPPGADTRLFDSPLACFTEPS